MPKEKQEKLLCINNLRHAEYYGMQEIFDDLYAKSINGEEFNHLMDVILSRENILLAYRNIKANTGSKTAGTDKLTIHDIGKCTSDEVVNKVRFIITGSKHGYRPKPVRRKEIPKPNGTMRPLGIPCIWDRLVQQCIKQVMEPICEAKFSDNSYGFRPGRSVEHAIQSTYKMIQCSNLHYVIEFDIKGFFDNVNHSKLIRQIWALGMKDKHLLWALKKLLTAPIKMPDGSIMYPEKGTPQGGIISPLLANIVLNELDHWIQSQWQDNPVVNKYPNYTKRNGRFNRGHGYRAMRTTGLKEMYIVRYADDFRIFCRTKAAAEKAKIAITQWLFERLRLEVSEAKTKIVNVKRRYSEFLGFKIAAHPKGQKWVVKSHIGDRKLKSERSKLVEQAKAVAKPPNGRKEFDEIRLYDSMVLGIQHYYRIATDISTDCKVLHWAVMKVFTNRLRTQQKQRLVRTGRNLTEKEQILYGASAMLRYVAGTDEPIYPIGYVHHKKRSARRYGSCVYSPEGRKLLHDALRLNTRLMWKLMQQPLNFRSVEYADNRVSLFSAQWGKCAVTGKEFMTTEEIHCHHIIPRINGGSDLYVNLVLILEPVHRLIHATDCATIDFYSNLLVLDVKQLNKVNEYRVKAGLTAISL